MIAEAPDPIREQQARLLKSACVRDFATFVRAIWPVAESAPLDWNWHFDVICRELTDVFEGRTQELVICIPPGTAKSLIVSVFWPAWVWLSRPQERLLCLANHPRLSGRDSGRMRRLISTPAYRALVEYQAEIGAVKRIRDKKNAFLLRPWDIRKGEDKVEKFINDYGGFRESTSIGSAITGRRGDGILIDDPYDAEAVINGSAAQVAARMIAMINKYENSITSRVNNERKAYKILVMQRLHPDDLAGHMIKNGARLVSLPMLSFEPNDPDRHPSDPRPQGGQSLHPERYPVPVILAKKSRMTPRHFAAQYQQKPYPPAGQLFKRDWIHHHKLTNLSPFDEVAISVDCTFKGAVESDFVVMQAWGRVGARYYLIDQHRARMSYVETRSSLIRFRAKHPRAKMVLIEDKANGSALISELRSHIPGIVAYDPKSASKYARAELAAVAWEAGNVFVPDPEMCPWVHDFIEEHIQFPGGANDDQVDTGSQMLLRWMDLTKFVDLNPLREFAAFATPVELKGAGDKGYEPEKSPILNW